MHYKVPPQAFDIFAIFGVTSGGRSTQRNFVHHLQSMRIAYEAQIFHIMATLDNLELTRPHRFKTADIRHELVLQAAWSVVMADYIKTHLHEIRALKTPYRHVDNEVMIKSFSVCKSATMVFVS